MGRGPRMTHEEALDIVSAMDITGAAHGTVHGDFDRAWGLYEEALALDGDEPGPHTVLTYQNMGMLRADQERWDEALEL